MQKHDTGGMDCRYRPHGPDFRRDVLERDNGRGVVEGESMRATLKIPCDGKKLQRIIEIESELRDVGVAFDTGYNFEKKTREWELDDVEGATIEVRA